MQKVKEFVASLPKSSIATAIGALLAYCQSKGILGGDEAMLISGILLALGITVNMDKFLKRK